MNIPKNISDPFSRFSLGIFTVNGLLMRKGDQITQSIGQSSARWQVLGRVDYKSQTVAQIAKDMGHARQSVQRIADVLAKEGCIIYKDNPADRRAQLLELTAKGERVLGEIYDRHKESTQRIMARLDAETLSRLADALEEVSTDLEAEVNNISKKDNPRGKK